MFKKGFSKHEKIKEERKIGDEFRIKKTWVYVAVIAIIALFLFGVIRVEWGTQPPEAKVWVAPDGTEFDNYADYYNYYMQHWGTPPPEEPPQTSEKGAAKVQFNIHDAVTDDSVSGTTTEVDITKVKNGYADFLTKEETVSVSSNPAQTALYYSEGDILILHVLSDTETDATNGADFYDVWYYVQLTEGANVYQLTMDCLTVAQTSPTYKYTLNLAKGIPTGYKVAYTAGTTPYWDIGVLKLYPRIAAAHMDAYLKHEGTTLAKVTDGSTWVDTDAEITANATMTTSNEDLTIELRADATNLCYGFPLLTVTQSGQVIERRAVVIVSTSMTTIGTQDLYDEGWRMVSKPDLTSEIAFYKIIDPAQPVKGDKFTISITFPIDASAAAASTKYVFKVWVLDCQVPSYVEQGSTTASVPTAYGFINEFGIDSIIYARALTVSSGAGDNEILRAYVTTPS